MATHQLEHEGRTLFFHDVGEGAPLLLLHAFPLSSRAFAPQLEAPPRGLRLIAPDLRGFGRSSLGAEPPTMERYAQDALALLDALELPSAAIGGVSMGGYISMALTRLDPGRVRGLVLVDTQSTADDEAGKVRREDTAKKVEAQGAKVLSDTMPAVLLSKGAPAAVRSLVQATILEQDPKAIAAAARAMALRTDSKDLLARFAGPCLIAVGSEDGVTPKEKSAAMAQLMPQATLEVIEGAGHLSNLEQPEAFSRLLERFGSLLG